jgi:hypothetical protein
LRNHRSKNIARVSEALLAAFQSLRATCEQKYMQQRRAVSILEQQTTDNVKSND